MLEFFRRLFAPEPRSSDTAKERLRLVLLSDHLSLAPDVVEALKRDLLAVISRYLEIDPALADVTFEQREREVAMLASIPIMGVRERSAAPAEAAEPAEPEAASGRDAAVPPPASPVPEPATEPQPAAEQQPEDEAIMEPGEVQAAAPVGSPAAAPAESPAAAPAEPPAAVAPADPHAAMLQAASADAARPSHESSSARRRRRKKAALANRPPQPLTGPEFGPA